MINAEKFEAKCEEIIAKYNMRVDWDNSPILGLVWDGDLDADAEAIVRGADVSHLRKYIKNRPAILARKAAQAKPATAPETAPATLTLEEQKAEIRKAESKLYAWEKDVAKRREKDENLWSVDLRPNFETPEQLRAKYPEAAKALDDERKADAEKWAELKKAAYGVKDPWNL